ncbi:hypothetical protein BN1708_019007, partial [Verticillium longisporum]
DCWQGRQGRCQRQAHPAGRPRWRRCAGPRLSAGRLPRVLHRQGDVLLSR